MGHHLETYLDYRDIGGTTTCINGIDVNNWTVRLRQSNRQRQINSKELQPLPKGISDGFSLQLHLHIEALRAGLGSFLSLQLLMRVALSAGMLQQLGYGKGQYLPIEELEAAAAQALTSGTAGQYRVDAKACQQFACVVSHYDWQLQHAPVKALAYVENKLDQYSK